MWTSGKWWSCPTLLLLCQGRPWLPYSLPALGVQCEHCWMSLLSITVKHRCWALLWHPLVSEEPCERQNSAITFPGVAKIKDSLPQVVHIDTTSHKIRKASCCVHSPSQSPVSSALLLPPLPQDMVQWEVRQGKCFPYLMEKVVRYWVCLGCQQLSVSAPEVWCVGLYSSCL